MAQYASAADTDDDELRHGTASVNSLLHDRVAPER
jgi:hypothetical protein